MTPTDAKRLTEIRERFHDVLPAVRAGDKAKVDEILEAVDADPIGDVAFLLSLLNQRDAEIERLRAFIGIPPGATFEDMMSSAILPAEPAHD